ncbi:hypothetical protein AMS68_007553 [Peltaster fructicola]|uniref:CHY-type domain-containing protein n=1 Tax=Peltaster fructicola TaxID=286661 RepID=A0A6H0Y4Z5_9PEZI|nr:hypothetical protein AMS68_007553 [Peltaster fructicola]
MATTTAQGDSKSGASKRRACRYFNTPKGDACPYSHVVTVPRQYQAPNVDTSRVVSKPQPKEDLRTFQIGQIKRRYNPEITEADDCDSFRFSFSPSDPDFPFDLEALSCVLKVPNAYPRGQPSLKVLNKEIPRGFQINIERGFSTICTESPNATLLGIMNRLDRQLEAILSGEMAETIKIVAHRPKPEPAPVVAAPISKPAPTKPNPPRTVHAADDKAKARLQRQADTRQLEARFGRLPAFKKSSDGLRYTLPLESPKKSTWPAPIQALRIFTLIVPELYPLEPPSLVLDSESDEARAIEAAFSRRPASSTTLTQSINLLTINMKDMAQEKQHQGQPAPAVEPRVVELPIAPTTQVTSAADPDRPHLHVIPRPPEWDMHESDGEDSDSYDTGDDTEASAEESHEEQVYSTAPIERGILLSFPNLELHSIELMEVLSLSITIKCDRCKEIMDVDRLRSITPESTAPRSESCKKCANGFVIGFRADLIHSNSVRAGYLDLDGCTIVDMLPSTFAPTCAECSVLYPGIVSVRGENTIAICRECHKKMTFRIPEIKFLQISAVNIRASRAPGRKPKEKLGVVAGTELPRRGRCTHYAKSYRWFRFSCCNKVFACDRCHDEAEEHPNEHANRMLCGYCSREQNYRPEDCGICHAVLIGRRGRGFWEGGKGTRDRARMSRKDPRKYKRIGGSAAAKKT